MQAELSINLHQLQEMVAKVRKTKRSETVRLADGVIAVVKPEWQSSPKPKRRVISADGAPTTYTLETAFGSVPTPSQLKGKDIDEIIRAAKEEHAEQTYHLWSNE